MQCTKLPYQMWRYLPKFLPLLELNILSIHQNSFGHFQITWIDGLGNVLSKGIEYVKEPLSDSRRITAKSILKLVPKKEHHNTTFTCQAQNTADRTYRAAKILIEVRHSQTFVEKIYLCTIYCR